MNDPWRTEYVTKRAWAELAVHACLIAYGGDAATVSSLLGVSQPFVEKVAAQTGQTRTTIRSYAAVAENVLDAWVVATERNPKRTRLNQKRTAAVRARLREGYTEDDLIAAVRGIGLSAFHRGDNPEGKRYDDMLVAIRDGERVETFRDLYEAGGDGPRSSVDRALDHFPGALWRSPTQRELEAGR